MAERWSCFLDESGEFDDETSVVAGVLVELTAEALARGPLPDEFAEIWGPGPYPPHASHLNVSASLVLHREWRPGPGAAAMPEGEIGRANRPLLDAAARELANGPHADLLHAARSGRRPRYEDLHLADHDLHTRCAGLYHALEHLRDERQRRMEDLIARVFARLGDGFSVVGALADRGPAGPAPAPGKLREDAYVRALAVVLERVARIGGEAVIDLYVLTRDVSVGSFPKPVGLGPHLIRQIADEAVARTGARVRFRSAPATQRYEHRPDDGLPFHPMHALADWVANRLRRPVSVRGRPWGALRAGLAEAGIVASPAMLDRAPRGQPTVGRLPLLAAAGAPEAAVRAAFAGAPPAPLPPGWAGDQAREWAQAARRWA